MNMNDNYTDQLLKRYNVNKNTITDARQYSDYLLDEYNSEGKLSRTPVFQKALYLYEKFGFDEYIAENFAKFLTCMSVEQTGNDLSCLETAYILSERIYMEYPRNITITETYSECLSNYVSEIIVRDENVKPYIQLCKKEEQLFLNNKDNEHIAENFISILWQMSCFQDEEHCLKYYEFVRYISEKFPENELINDELMYIEENIRKYKELNRKRQQLSDAKQRYKCNRSLFAEYMDAINEVLLSSRDSQERETLKSIATQLFREFGHIPEARGKYVESLSYYARGKDWEILSAHIKKIYNDTPTVYIAESFAQALSDFCNVQTLSKNNSIPFDNLTEAINLLKQLHVSFADNEIIAECLVEGLESLFFKQGRIDAAVTLDEIYRIVAKYPDNDEVFEIYSDACDNYTDIYNSDYKSVLATLQQIRNECSDTLNNDDDDEYSDCDDSDDDETENSIYMKSTHERSHELIAVIDTETTWQDDVMSIGIVIAKAQSLEPIGFRYYLITPECSLGGMYASRLIFGKIKPSLIQSRNVIMEQLIHFLNSYNVDHIYAYNASYDRNHLPELSKFEWYDIMRIAAYKQYNKAIPDNAECFGTGKLKKNYGVQPIMQMLTGDKKYAETHNALLDAMDELKIMRLLGHKTDIYEEARI